MTPASTAVTGSQPAANATVHVAAAARKSSPQSQVSRIGSIEKDTTESIASFSRFAKVQPLRPATRSPLTYGTYACRKPIHTSSDSSEVFFSPIATTASIALRSSRTTSAPCGGVSARAIRRIMAQ